jgi:hypothetical protein
VLHPPEPGAIASGPPRWETDHEQRSGSPAVLRPLFAGPRAAFQHQQGVIMTTGIIGGLVLSGANRKQLVQIEQRDRELADELDGAREAAAWRSRAAAAGIYEAQEIRMQMARNTALLAERREEAARAEKRAQIEDHRAGLVLAGHRPRTVAEILGQVAGRIEP